jgi:CheY-like chemotaxis protein
MPFTPNKANLRHMPYMIGFLTVMSLAVISALDYFTGYELSFFLFYFVPISLAAWFYGVRAGAAMSAIATVCWYLSYRLSGGTFPTAFIECWNTGMRFFAFIVLAMVVARLSREMTTLQSLLPICGCCKKIRNDAGYCYWEQVEDYFRPRARTTFTHCMCPECSERLHKPNTLFVESKPDEVFALKDALVKAGLPHVLHHVENTRKAMEWLSGGAVYSDRKRFPLPDLVVVDSELEGENSFKFVEWLSLQTDFRGIPILFVDSFRENGKIERAYQMGVASCFSKGAEYQDLADFLRTSRA